MENTIKARRCCIDYESHPKKEDANRIIKSILSQYKSHVNFHIKDKNGKTVLMIALENGNAEMANALLEAEAGAISM